MSRKLLIGAGCLFAALACSGGGGSNDGGEDSGSQSGPCSALANQGIGETCCVKYGSTACSGAAFCSGPSGGTGTCTANGTQPDGQPCTADTQCASGGCNSTEGKCESSLDTTCTQALGCGPVSGGFSYCDPATSLCKQTTGQCMSDCVTAADCAAPTIYCVGATASAAGQCCYTSNSPCTCQPIQP